MSVYQPGDLLDLWLVVAVFAGTVLTGFAITRIRAAAWARLAAWVLIVSAAVGVERLCAREPAGFRMLAVIGALLLGMKAIVSVESRRAGQPPLSAVRWLAFACGWPGMRPALFTTLGGPPLAGAGRLVVSGIKRVALGVALVVLARLIWRHSVPWLPAVGTGIVATLPLLLGLSLIIHFGVFDVLAGGWRLAGVDCRPLFRTPLRSRNLTEFWGRRWNLAFSEMAAVAIYRPLVGRLGKGGATAAAFLYSGLVHELAISVPVMAGFGLPFFYFVLHGGLVLLERRLERAGRPIDRVGRVGMLWAFAWLAVPLPMLFHPYFLAGVVWPLMGCSSCH